MIGVVKEMNYKHPVGVRCMRKVSACASWWHDKRCYGETCPFKNGKAVVRREERVK